MYVASLRIVGLSMMVCLAGCPAANDHAADGTAGVAGGANDGGNTVAPGGSGGDTGHTGGAQAAGHDAPSAAGRGPEGGQGAAGSGSLEAGSSAAGSGGTPNSDPTALPELMDCTTGIAGDGWEKSIFPDHVQLFGHQALVELYYPFPLDDALRMQDALLNRALGGRFKDLVRAPPDEIWGPEARFVRGYATEVDSKAQVYVGFTPVVDNGVAQPVLAVALDEAHFVALFASGEALGNMQRYNYFPLSCAQVVGTWSAGFNYGSVLRDIYGNIIYTQSNSLQVTLDLQLSGSYSRHEKSYMNTLVQQSEETGAFSLGANEITFTLSTGTVVTRPAGLVARAQGFGLYLTDLLFNRVE